VPTANVPVAAAGPHARDVMLRGPRTLAPGATVAEARAAFENPRERLLLVAEDGRLLGAVRRDAITDALPADAPLGDIADTGMPRVGPDEPVERVLALLDADYGERLPVVAPDGALLGLVCFNRARGVFCVSA
jgi:CBS domain-containing protein